MKKPTFPLLEIIFFNGVISIIVGYLLGAAIYLFLAVIGAFSNTQFNATAIILITGISTFSIITYFSISRYNDNKKDFEKVEQERLSRESIRKEIEEERKKKEEDSKKKFDDKKNSLIKLIDKIQKYPSKNSRLVLLENDFQKLFIKYENIITEIDKKENKNYVLQFVKISNYIKEKKSIIDELFDDLLDIKNDNSINTNDLDFIEEEIEEIQQTKTNLDRLLILYEQVILHSINMVIALINDKRFTFYEIYELFDKMGIFDSNWQNSVVKKLDYINQTLSQIDINLERGLENLTYVFENSFAELGNTITAELQSINSNIRFNNLLTAIQTRKLYQIRSDTKKFNL